VLSEILPLVTYRRYPGPGLVPRAWGGGGEGGSFPGTPELSPWTDD
jgi:hypothetical protein